MDKAALDLYRLAAELSIRIKNPCLETGILILERIIDLVISDIIDFLVLGWETRDC